MKKMKLRIKGNSLRFRVTRPELDRLAATGRIEETLWLGPGPGAGQTYALEHNSGVAAVTLRFQPPEIAVVLPTAETLRWQSTPQVGIYATVSLGPRGTLEITVEKDFACLDSSVSSDPGAFPNPRAGAVC
jgi:hypothetical protein